MNEEWVKIEINGVQVEARKGAMIIEVTDTMDVRVPRFCYHDKLSVAANCRMCLVEVEKLPKPLPACATPVMDGMKVYTDSPKAIAAQKSTMEFLLINHPLDCPICDQGGECELQDLAMGYGGDVSRFTERKRVVKDKDIGSLISTEMTRCIHCTRCVRFGEEIAGLRELGATGRGEHMEIGTYIEKSIVSELSGNVIDLCPVGALTAKPSRYTGRSWEYVQHAGVSPHDSVGSNLYWHTIRGKVMRVVPRENEAINEVWLSDRDRFSYEAIYSDERALQPLVRGDSAEWNDAFEAAASGLNAVIAEHGADAVGVLVSPSATLEEMYLAQKLARGLGVVNIDHRLRQGDFSDQETAPVYPWLGQPLQELDILEAALLVGSNVRMEQPIASHRLRKAALAGGKIMFINPRDYELRFPVAAKSIADPITMISILAGVAKAVAQRKGVALPHSLRPIAASASVSDTEQQMAEHLVNCERTSVFLGNLAVLHPAFSQLRALATFVAANSNSRLGYLPEAANSVGGWLAGVLPHREAGAKPASRKGLDARALLEAPRRAYVLIGVEPELDCWDSAAALAAVKQAEFVVVLHAYVNDSIRSYTDVLLPAATPAETSGTYINAEGHWQGFSGASRPLGESRPAWKILRVLGNALNLDGFEYADSQQVLEEVQGLCEGLEPDNLVVSDSEFTPLQVAGLMRTAEVPIYATDALVRRAPSLQKTPLARPVEISINPELARELGLAEAKQARICYNGSEAVLPLVLDEALAKGCVCVPSGLVDSVFLGPAVGPIELGAA